MKVNTHYQKPDKAHLINKFKSYANKHFNFIINFAAYSSLYYVFKWITSLKLRLLGLTERITNI